MTYQDCCKYFSQKLRYWNTCRHNCDLVQYINLQGREGLCDELRSDSQFMNIVCPFLHTYANTQETNLISSMISAIRDDLTQPIVGIIVGAALDTCGYKEGREYMKIALLAFILGGLVFMLGQKSKTGKRRRQKKA